MTYLVGDIGGTSSRFAWVERDGRGAIKLQDFIKLSNDDYDDFASVVRAFLSQTQATKAKSALFAMAGPVGADGGITLTNRNWPRVLPREICSACSIGDVTLVNDFAAMARAIPEMTPDCFEEIRVGKAVQGAPIVVTGPGTGFGVATLIPARNDGWRVLTGEGGHAAYAPRTMREAELAHLMAQKFDYISTEMIVAGAWTQSVFNFLCDLYGTPRLVLPASEIRARADAGDTLCAEFCRIRSRAIISAVGDLVLINGARGGAVLTGSVAERMVEWLNTEDALAQFTGRGGHSAFMANIPISVLTEATAPLIGAAALLLEKES